MRGCADLTNMPQQQQPQPHMPSQAYANFAMGSLQVCFSFRAEPPNNSYVMCWCLLWCFLLSGSHMATVFNYGDSTDGLCNTATLQSLPFAGIHVSW